MNFAKKCLLKGKQKRTIREAGLHIIIIIILIILILICSEYVLWLAWGSLKHLPFSTGKGPVPVPSTSQAQLALAAFGDTYEAWGIFFGGPMAWVVTPPRMPVANESV